MIQTKKQTNKQTKLFILRLSLIILGAILLHTFYLLHFALMSSNLFLKVVGKTI